MNNKLTKGLISFLFLLTISVSHAAPPKHAIKLFNPNTPSLTVINTISHVSGQIAGFVDSAGNINGDMMNPDNVSIVYPISGTVHATVTEGSTGETLGSYSEVGSISATASFSTAFFGLMGDWAQLPKTLPWTMTEDFAMKVSGSTFVFEEKLTGRAFPQLGPVENPMETGTMALRMSGCAGVRETSGVGAYAGKVGTLCLNGTFTFDQNFNGVGVSNCSIAVHDPVQM